MVSYSLLVLFVKKTREGIELYVDYRELNAIIQKDCYLIPLITKILAQFKSAKYFAKIDIHQAFYQIRMSKDSKKLITFLTRFDAFK